METHVKIFTSQETALEDLFDAGYLEEYKKLIDDLGLKGQQGYSENASVCPYPRLREFEKNILQEVFSDTTAIEEFNSEPIPVEVLRHVELNQKEGWFYRIEVWHSSEIDDPFVIGRMRDPEYPDRDWRDKRFLIAQWGEELLPMDRLAAKAKEKYLARKTYELEKAITDNQNELKLLKSEATRRFFC